MSFEYACFISYRGYSDDDAADELIKRFIEDLDVALSIEIRTSLEEGVYRDKNRLQPGDFFNAALARAICKSVCMIIVFTPRYFDSRYTYCAREYKAMKQLEQERLPLLDDPAEREHGLIIPLVFRGSKFLPQELKSVRHFASFDDFTLASERISRHPVYADGIKKLAEYIVDRCVAFSHVSEAFENCTEFKIPAEETIRPWLANITPFKSRFVNR